MSFSETPLRAAIDAGFDFDKLLLDAIVKERGLANDDTEGYPLDPVFTPFSSPTLLSPCPDSPINSNPIVSEPPDLVPPLSLPPPFIEPSASQPIDRVKEPRPVNLGNVETHIEPPTIPRNLRQGRCNAKRAVKRRKEKAAGPFGLYKVQRRTVKKYIEQSKPIRTSLETRKLKHAKTGYLGLRDEGGAKQVFQLEELVGAGSKYGFTLKKWSGR
jgi:hypothetical protein